MTDEPRQRPIIFSGPMVRALLAGTKMQTRRVIKTQPEHGVTRCHYTPTGWSEEDGRGSCRCKPLRCPYKIGDLLYARETFATGWTYAGEGPCVFYRANGVGLMGDPDRPVAQVAHGRFGVPNDRGDATAPEDQKWKSSRYMPKWAARIWLRVTDVRAEQLQEITEFDAVDEGVNRYDDRCSWCGGTGSVRSSIDIRQAECPCRHEGAAKRNFELLWDSINAKRGYPWESDPWVWVVEFERTDIIESERST